MADIAQEMRYKIDVKNGLVKQPMTGVLMRGDKNANRIIAQLVDGDKTVSLDGVTVTGKFFRGGDGIEIPLDGEASGNEATVLLNEHCYAVEGYFEASVRMTTGGATRTILTITGHVESDGEGGILDIENVVPSVADIVAQYQIMQEVTAQTEAAAESANTAAGRANTAAEKIDGMTVSATSGTSADASVSDKNGAKHIDFVLPQGDPGNTPYIGGNGNWWVGGEDTGTKAQGPAGQNGKVTSVTVDGEKYDPDEHGNVGIDLDRKYAAKTRYGKAVFFGDSLSVGSSNNDYSFVDVLSESGMFESVTKRAYGGATIGPYSIYSEANDYCLINQITRYTSDIQSADIIFLEYGANDYNSIANGLVSPGYATDTSTDTTICGYLRAAFDAIKAINPKARLVWLAFTRWHDGIDVGAEEHVSEDFLLYCEASLFRIAREYHCGIIGLIAEYNSSEFLSIDNYHPNTEGHTLIAQNILANLFKSTSMPRLFRQVGFTVASDGTVTVDSSFSIILGLLKTGAVDVYGVATYDGSTYRHPLRCVLYSSSMIVFCGNSYNDSYEQSTIEFSWTSSGVNYRKI